MAEWERKMGECPKCGNPRELCSDPTVAWYPQRTICYASMAQAESQRKYDSLHEARPFHDGTFERWAEKYSAAFPYRVGDGETIWVSNQDLTPDDDFLGEKANEISPETLGGQ